MCYIVTILIKAWRTGWIRANFPMRVSLAGVYTDLSCAVPWPVRGQEEGVFLKPSLVGAWECCSSASADITHTEMAVKAQICGIINSGI